MSARVSYALDNQHPKAADLHAALAELYDADTIGRLVELSGGDNWAGATCLEVGAGAGSVASVLADAVGSAGRVVAIDLKVDRIPARAGLEVRQIDLRTDPVPPGPYGLIHARRVLEHLPEREPILDRLVAELAPGGVIFIEDGVRPPWDEMVIAAPSSAAASLYVRYQQTMGAAVWDVSGRDGKWAGQIHSALLARGLTEVETRIHGGYWTGGQGPGCQLMSAALHHVRPRLLEAGLSAADLDTVLGLLQDPRLVVRGHSLYATSGRRPT